MNWEKIFERNKKFAKEAVHKMGGPTKAARILSERLYETGIIKTQIKFGHIRSWLYRDKRGFPIEMLEAVELETGVKREDLRADIPWRRQ